MILNKSGKRRWFDRGVLGNQKLKHKAMIATSVAFSRSTPLLEWTAGGRFGR